MTTVEKTHLDKHDILLVRLPLNVLTDYTYMKPFNY